jgi:hypothetical protein
MSSHLLGHGHMDVASPRCRPQFEVKVPVTPVEYTTSPYQICIPILRRSMTPLLMKGTHTVRNQYSEYCFDVYLNLNLCFPLKNHLCYVTYNMNITIQIIAFLLHLVNLLVLQSN